MALTLTASINAATKVTQLYVAMFGRAPDLEGLNFWGGGLDAGQTVAKIAQDMFATTPARAYFPSGSSSEQVIQAFYVNVLGRQPDAEGLAFWVARLDALKEIGNVNAEGQVVTEIIDIVANYQGNTPEGAESARLFANKIEVANFWVAENGSAENAGKPIALVTSNPDSVVQVKTQILSDFSVGTITLKEAVVDGALQPIRLTTEGSNAGTTATTAGDDTIVAGRLELLHQAYIDGGLGRNTLEIDAKGVYAQPAALLNIQEVRVHNLPNVYTVGGNASGYLGNSSYPQLASNLAAASEVIPASAFNKLVVTANQLKLTVDGQSHAVPAGIYTAESLAEAINAVAGSVVAVVNAAGVSIDGAAMTFRGNAAGQISAAEFNSVVINDLQLQVVNNGVETGPAVVPAGVYTAVDLAAAINALVPGVATVDAASSAAAALVGAATDARADLAAAQLSLDAAEAREAAADALDEYTDARNAETTAQANAATASQAADDANANLTLANVAVDAANAQAAAQTVFNAAVSAQAAATARTNAANAAETLKVTAAQASLTAAQDQVTAAKTALDAVIDQISDKIDAASQALLTSAEGAVTQAETAVTAAQANFDAKSTALDTLLALPEPTNAQIQAAQTALTQAQEALAQANADLTGATQARTEVALTIAKGLVDVNVDHLGLPVLQNEYAQAQGVATQAGVAVVAAQAAQAATQAAGVAEVDAATAARNSASDALNAATSAAADALDAVAGTGTAAELLADAQAAAITAGTNLQLAQAAVTAATAAVNDAFAGLQAAQAAADAANQAAARELAQAGSTDGEIATALAHDVAQAAGAVTAAQTVLAAAETALANATAGNLFGGSGSVVITANDTAQEIRFYGNQAFAFGLGDIAQDGTLTIPGRLSNSVIDLSRATALDRLVITEGAGTQVATAGALPVGDLTVVGVRNGAVLRLEGSFTQDVNIEYSAGMSSTEPLKLELVLGDVAETASLNLVHNTSALHIDSLGGGANRLDSVDLGQGTLSKLIVSGNAGFYVAGDLASSFSDDVAIIDASANTVGVSLVLSGTRTVEVLGTRGNDYFNIGSASSGSSDATESVVIKDTTGNNTYVVNSFDATITTGDGNNVILVDAGNKAQITAGNGVNRFDVSSGGDAIVTAGEGNATVLVDSAADAQVTLGGGKHAVSVFADDRAQVVIGAGDSRVSINAGESYLTTGNGNNRVTVAALEGDAEVVGGDGNSQYTVTATEGHAHVTAGNGDNTFNLTADQGVRLITGNGTNQIVVDDTEGDVTIIAGDGNSVVDVTTTDNIGVTVGNGNGRFELASAAGGVNLSVGAGNQSVEIDADTIVVNGGATGNGTYLLSGADADSDDLADSITLTLGAGNNKADVYAQSATINAANGDNQFTVVAEVLKATVGNGNSIIDVTGTSSTVAKANVTAGNGDTDIIVRSVLDATVISGDGESVITVSAAGKASVISGNGDKTVEINQADIAEVVLGDGNSNVNTDDIDVVSITVGDGQNVISSVRGESVTVVAGDGGNSITISADQINVTTGSGNDTIVVSGMLGDIDLTDITGDGNTTGLLNINVGAGQNTVVLGRDVFNREFGITALEGSSISGENITLRVENLSDLRAAELSGIEHVVLNYDLANPVAQQPGNHALAPVLTLTDTQFLAIGAANFAVQGAIFNNYAQIKIIVTQTTSLTALGVDSLPRNIDLQLEVQDGVTLTMTAQQLHTKVAPGGVTLAQDLNTDLGNGKVVITGAGENFDPFNHNDAVRTNIGGTVYYGGSLSTDFAVDGPDSGTIKGDSKSEWYNVTLKGGYGGYNRPADVPVEEVWTIDGDAYPTVGAHSTWNYNIEVIGTGDVVFTGAGNYGVELGENATPFVIDFSQLDGEAIGLTLGNFENVGAVYGNSANGYAAVVNVELDNVADTTAGDPNGLVTSGVSKYVVTKIGRDGGTANAGITATIVLGFATQDLEVIALRGNYNDTLVVDNAIPGVTFELQGGAKSGNGPNGTANVGKLEVNYEWDTPDAVVNLVRSVVGDTRDIHAYGIEINNADTITINAGTANAVINSIVGNSLDHLVLEGGRNVSITETLDLTTGLDSIDASAVDGNLTLSLSGAATDSGFDFVASAGTTNLSLSSVTAGTHSSFVAETAAVFNVFVSGENNDLSKATLTNVDTLSLGKVGVVGNTTVTLSATQALDIGLADIKLTHPGLDGTLNLVNLGNQAFNASALGAGVELGTVSIAAGNVTLDAATVLTGAEVLVAAGSTLTLTADQYMALADLDGVASGVTIHITGLTQAHINAGFDLANVSNATGTISLAENVNLAADTDLNGFTVVLANNQTLGVATAAQADGLQVNGGVGSTIEIQFLDINGQPGRDVLGAGNSLDASGYNVDKVRIPEVLIGTGNVDWMFANLPERVVKSIYQLGWVDGVSQTVEIEAGTTVPGWLVINITDEQVEVRDLTVNLLGGAKLDGNLRLTTTEKLDDAGNPLFHTLLKTLTINSTGTAENALTGQTANIIDGNIAPTPAQGGGGAGYTAVENNLLNVTINAEQDLVVTGSVVFNSRVDEDLLIPNDEAAVAKLTVTGTANVTIGNLSTTDDDVDSLVVTNNGTGVLTVGIDGSATGFDAADALSFVGTGDIVLRITGAVDLTNDNLAAVSAIQLVGTATVTLTADQVEALGAANITKSGTTGAATLEVIGLDSADTFDSTLVGNGVVINVTTAAGDVVLNAAANLTDISSLTVAEGNSITLTADQALTLLVEGVTPVQSITFDGDGTVNVTNANQADFDAGLGAVLIAMNAGLEAGTLGITGDLNLTASIVNAAAVDGFALEGDVPGLRIDVTMDAANREGDPTGDFAGDLDLGLAAGTDAVYNIVGINKDAGVTSRNIATYVVTALDAGATDVFYVCNATEGLTTLGLQGNGGDTIYFGGVKRDVTFLLEGDGYASWSDVEKRDQSPDASNIGALVAAFYTPNNPMAVVNINNQGVALTDGSIAGTERKLVIDGVTINNTLGLTINVADGDATIGSVGGSTLDTLNLVAVEDLFITAALPGSLDTIDATAVGGLFKATISDNDFDLVTGANADITITGTILESTASIDGTAGTLNLNIGTTSDLSAGTLISVETLKIASGVSVTLSAAQVAAIGEADISGVAGGSAETLNINGMTGAITINQALLGTGVVLGTVTMAAGSHTLSAGTDLTGASLVVPAGGTLTLTADQYMALADLDGIAPTGSQTAAVIHITGLTQAHIDAGFSLANVSNVNFALSDVALDPAATTVNLGSATNLNGFGVDLSANQTLGIATSVQADGLRIAGDSTNTVVFRFDALDGATVSGDSRIDASKYSIGTLRAMDAFFTDPSALNGEENAEFVIQGLNENVTLVVYTDPTLLGIQGYNRTVIVETGVTVPAEFVFNDTGAARELIDLTITLQGDATVNGDLRLPTAHANGSGARFFDDLVINSTGAASAGGNRILGDITPVPEVTPDQNPTSTTERENNLLKVTIGGDKALAITGDIVFNKVGDNNAATTIDNGAATLTVTSTAAVTVGGINTLDADVTSLTVDNTGGGTLSLTIDAAKIDATDALAFTGDDIALTVAGNVDLSNDNLAGVDSITIAQNATLTLSQAQFDALGAANIIDGGADGAAILNLNAVNAVFDATSIDPNIDVQTLTLAGSMDFAATASNLSEVDSIVVPAGATLTLTAAQFQQLKNAGTIVGAGAATNYTVHITGLTQADIDSGAFDTSGITAGTITLSLDANVNLSADDVIENVDTVILTDGQTLGLATEVQADDLNVNGGLNTTIVFQFTPHTSYPGQINAAGYNVTTLKALAAGFTIGGNSNVEYSIDDLPSSVELRLYEDPEQLGYLDQTFRKVVIEAGITTPSGLVFNDWDTTDEVRNLTLTLEGDVTLDGSLSIPTRTNKDNGSVQLYFDTLTVVSTGTAGNTINGDIDTDTVPFIVNDTSDNNLLKVTLSGDAALEIVGDIVFNKVGNDAVGGGDDGAAVLTVTNTAPVTIGALDTSDADVTSLTVSNTGGATLSVTIDANKIDATDALNFLGDNIALTVEGAVDLSNDNLVGVDSIVIGDNATLTVTQAQFDALGAANFGTDGTPVAVNLVITEFGSDPFDATDLAAGINVESIVLAATPAVITLDPATNLTGVDQIEVPEGSTLRLTAAQFQQLQDSGTIVGFDLNGDSTVGAFNVEIYDVRQANVAADTDNDGVVDAGDQVLDLSNLGNTAVVTLQLASDVSSVTFGSFTSTGVSAPAFASDLFVGTSGNLASIEMGNNQSVVFVSAAQADGIRVTGGTNSNIAFAFDDTGINEASTGGGLSVSGNGIDASLYNVTNLRALNVFVDGRNVEQVVENLNGNVTLVVYQNPEDIAIGFRSAVNRTVIIEPNVSIDDFVAFIDLNTAREIRNLTIEMQGGTEIDGNVRLATMPQASPTTQPRYFDTLTIASTGTAVNRIDGDITAQPAAATPSQIGSVENNLLNVVVAGTQNLVITGDIVFSKVGNGAVGGGDDATANLTITNSGTTTIEQLDVSDNDLSGLTIVNNGGLLTVTGASPAVTDGTPDPTVLGGTGANLETLTLSGTGNITFGLNPNVTTETGLDLGNVSTINASALSGNLNLGEVTNIDNANFSFISGTGVTTLTLTSDTLLEGTPLTDTGWSFDFSNAAAGSAFHLGSAAGTSLGFDNGGAGTAGTLAINLGSNTTLYIDETTDLTDLDLLITQGTAPAIVLADGVTLTLTAAQADGLRIVGANGAASTGVVNITQLGTGEYDLSGISADIANTATLAGNDVTLHADTNLGAFSITLDSNVDAGGMDLSGQTIRFTTQAQADGRDIFVANDTDNAAGVNSTNVVWLFESVTDAPLDTDGYSGLIGRLWMKQALLNGANVEQLFTSLPTTIVRSEFTSVNQLDGFLTPSQPVDRVVELVAFTNLPGGMTFNDTDALEGIRTLTLNLGGQVSTGDILIDDAVATGTDPASVVFNELSIFSYRALHQDHLLAPEAYVNDNDGTNEPGEYVQPGNINTVGDIRIEGVANSGIDLLTVNLNTLSVSAIGSGLSQYHGADLVVGTITFDSAAKATPVTAALNVAGANNTTVEAVDATDGDIDTLSITNSGSGNLVVTGASPAASLGSNPAVSNVETLVINATSTGSVTLGTALDATKPGVSGDDLSLIDVNGSGDVNLGVIALVDGNDFTLDTEGSSGDVTAVFDGMTLNAGGNWTVEGAWNGGGSLAITLKDTVTLGAGTLTIDDAVITISGNVDFTTLLDLDIVDVNDVTFIVPLGSSLTILAEDADGLTVTGGGVVHVEALEATPGADLSNIMTGAGDTGSVEAALDSTGNVELTGDLGIAHVTISGNGIVTVDDLATMADSTFTVGAAATLSLHADQADGRVVNGAGTTNIEDIGLAGYAANNDVDYFTVASAQVNIAVNTSVVLDSDDNLGTAGANRDINIGAGATLTAAGSVITGHHIHGEDATLLVDDENDNGNDNTAPADTAITADLSNVDAEFITLVDTAEVGTITFPVLYGSPAAKDLDPLVAVQTVEMTAAQASGQTINGAGAGTQGEVIVNALGAGFTNLSLIDVGRATAFVPADATLHAGTTLGEFAVVLDGVDVDLVLTAAQADGRSITDAGADGDSVTVTALELTPNADLSAIDVQTETALLDANGGVTLGANLGANMEVIVSDSVVGGPNTVTFTGEMVSADTTFTIAADAITLVFDANDAHELTVAEQAPGYANSAVTVNNVDGDLMDLTGITADTLVANVPADAVMHAGTNFGGFNVVLAEGADLELSFAQFLNVGVNDAALDAVDFSSAAGGVEEIVTVTGWIPATALDTSVIPATLALKLVIAEGSGASQTVNAATNLSGVEEIVIPAGVTLTMTADQFQQIQHSVTVTGAGTLNLTMFDNDNASIDLSSVTANAGTISLDPAAGATTVTAGQVTGTPVIVNPLAILDNAAGAKFGIVMTADNQGITLSSESQADGRSVTEAAPGFADTRLILGFQNPDAQDGDVNLEASGYGTDEVYVLNTYLFNQFGGVTPANIESFLNDLDPAIPVIVFDADAALVANIVLPTAVTGYTRTFVVEPNTLVNASVLFNDLDADSEVLNVIVNLRGNAYINGNLSLPQNEDPRGQLPTKYVQLFNTLTINSTDEVGALVSPNVLNGNIFANNVLNGAESQVEVFTLTLDPGMAIAGSEDQIGFDGAVVNLGDGWTVDQVGAALAAAQYTNWGASYDAVTNVVTFTNITAGAMTDAAIGSFTFQANSTSANFPGTSAVAVTQQGVFQGNENNLLNVVINAEHDLTITGTLEFRYVSGTDSIVYNNNDVTAEANLTIDVDAGVTVNIGSVNTGDDHITALNFVKTGTGTVNAPGTSPGASVGDTETLYINQVDGGVITFGTAGDPLKPGVAGDDLSLIEIDGVGEVNLGVISLVDTAAPVAPAVNSFYLDATGSAGDVTATIGADLAAGGVWSFENGLTGTLNLTINEDASFAAGSTLNIQGATITIDGDIDLSGVDLSGVQNGCEFVVPAGSVLTLSVEQALEFAADNIPATGSGTIKIVGDATDANSAALGAMLQTVTVDLSGVTLTLAGVGADADGKLEFQNATATNDLGAPAAQNLIGSAHDDLFLLSNNNDTVTGGLGNDTYTGGTGYYTYNVDAGTDTITSLYSDVGGNDVLVVTAGATAIAAGITEFVATAATVNNGTANLSTDATGGEINVSAAGGTGRFNLTGGADVDVLVGGAGSDVINGGLNGLGYDVLTGGLGADYFVFNIVQNNPTTPTVSTTTQGVDREQITFTKPDAVDDATSLTIAYRINGSLTTPGTVVDITAVNSGDVTAVAAAVGIHLAGVFGSNATVSVNAGVVTLQGANGVAIEIVSVTPNAGTLVGAPAEAVVLDTPQTTQLTIPAGTAVGGDYVVGDILSFTFTFAEGTGGTVNYTVNTGVGHGVTQAQVTAGVAAAINANWDLQLDTSVGGNVISVTSTAAGADFGGFSVTAGAVGGVSATGASDLNPATLASVDRIMDFVSGTDKIVLSVAGTVANFEAGLVQEASFAAAKAAAETAFTDPGVRYFFTAVNDINADTNADGVLFFDLNGDAVVDGAIALIGVTSMAAGDIVTTVV